MGSGMTHCVVGIGVPPLDINPPHHPQEQTEDWCKPCFPNTLATHLVDGRVLIAARSQQRLQLRVARRRRVRRRRRPAAARRAFWRPAAAAGRRRCLVSFRLLLLGALGRAELSCKPPPGSYVGFIG